MDNARIESYFRCLGQLNPGLATKVAAKGQDNLGLFTVFTKLAAAEEAYNSLDYLKPKRFRRDNYITLLYTSISDEIDSIENNYISRAKDSPSAISSYLNKKSQTQQLLYAIKEVAKIRKFLVKGYKLLANSPAVIPFGPWFDIVDEAWFHFEYYHFPEVMKPLTKVLKFEMQVLKLMIQAHNYVADYDMKNSILSLHQAHQIYIDWKRFVSQSLDEKIILEEESTQSTTPSVLSFISSLADRHFNINKPRLQVSSLMQWLEIFYDHLTAKLTLYFNEPLLEREKSIGGDSKSLWRHVISIDYPQFIRNFIKKSGAYHVCLIYEVDRTKSFSRDGFICQQMVYEPLSGLESYPFIFNCPEEVPKDYRPGLISMIMSHNQAQLKLKNSYEPQSPVSSAQSLFSSESNNLSSTNTLNIPGVNALSSLMSASGLGGFGYSNSHNAAITTTTITSTQSLPLPDTHYSKTPINSGLLSPRTSEYPNLPEPMQFYDRVVGVTYLLSRIDQRVTVAILFVDKFRPLTRENEGLDFLKELTDRLRLTFVTKMLTSLET